MELQFLKKQTRAHKYRSKLSHAEILVILERHAPRLRSIQIFTSNLAPSEVYDEYLELRNRIVERARADLQNEFKKKIKAPQFSDTAFALNHYLQNI
jgi:hypothetical protein